MVNIKMGVTMSAALGIEIAGRFVGHVVQNPAPQLHRLRGTIEQVAPLKDEAQIMTPQQGALTAARADRHRRLETIVSRRRLLFMQVLLPEPLGPIVATNSPCSTRKPTPRARHASRPATGNP